jgi:integrase
MTCPTVAEQAGTFLKLRTNRTASHDRYYAGYALGSQWFAGMRLDEVRPKHAVQLIRELQASGRAPKTITSTVSLMTVMFRDAVIDELISSNPFLVVPRGLVKRGFKRTQPYSAVEVNQLLTLDPITFYGMFVRMLLFTSMRPGEAAGRRWHDWDPNALPLGGLYVHSQYADQPLKTDDGDVSRPRMVPVHPELARALEVWRRDGWRLTYGVDPKPDDFIIPSRQDCTRPVTRSGMLQTWKAACKRVGVVGREVRATRNTFVTHARRSSSRVDIIEGFTHNAAGAMIDRYCVFEWGPRCDAMNALSFEVRTDARAPTPLVTEGGERHEPHLRHLNRRIRQAARTYTRHVEVPDAALRQRVDELIRKDGLDKTAGRLGVTRLALAVLALGYGSNRATIDRVSAALAETRAEPTA